jgi:hypothetical protein
VTSEGEMGPNSQSLDDGVGIGVDWDVDGTIR